MSVAVAAVLKIEYLHTYTYVIIIITNAINPYDQGVVFDWIVNALVICALSENPISEFE